VIDVEKTIISQYGSSPTISALIHNMNEYIDPSINFYHFGGLVWQVDTAVGFGLDIWGRIVNVGRELTVILSDSFFGFEEALPDSEPFNQAPFYNGVAPTSSVYILSDTEYRKLIMVKALSNISSTSAPSLNQLISNMFVDRGKCYVNDLGDMKMEYVFEFVLSDVEIAIITSSGAMPRPSGVEFTISSL
jgi:hypothetical protein